MPTYEITSPDGQKYRATVPDGVSQDDVLRHFQQQSETKDAPNPTDRMSIFDRFVAGYGKAGADIARGAGQRLGIVSAADVERSRREDAPLMKTTSGAVGNLVGNLVAAAPTAFIPGANSALGAALVGGLYGLAQPTTSGESPITNAMQSAAFSGVLTAGVRALPSVWNALAAPFTDSGRTQIAVNALNRFARDPNAVSSLTPQSTAPLVAGSKPTLAEVTGDPGIAQLQRTLQAKSPDAASDFAIAAAKRADARSSALQDIAGDPGKRDFFAADRKAAAQKLYEQAFQETPSLTPWIKGQITQLQSRPAFLSAFNDAKTIALNKGIKLDPSNAVQVLHYTKLALDDAAGNATGNAQQAILDTRDKLVSLMESKDFSPSYRAARETYAAMSKPINEMDVGKYLYDKLRPALADTGEGLARERPSQFAEALRQGDTTAKRATGFKGAKLENILSPSQMKSVSNVAKDLARVASADESGAIRGSRTAQYMTGQNIMKNLLSIGLPEGWAEWIANTLVSDVVSRPLSSAVKPVEERIQQRLAQILLDPEEAMRAEQAVNQTTRNMLPATLLYRAAPAVAIGMRSYATQQ